MAFGPHTDQIQKYVTHSFSAHSVDWFRSITSDSINRHWVQSVCALCSSRLILRLLSVSARASMVSRRGTVRGSFAAKLLLRFAERPRWVPEALAWKEDTYVCCYLVHSFLLTASDRISIIVQQYTTERYEIPDPPDAKLVPVINKINVCLTWCWLLLTCSLTSRTSSTCS
jgi:hypothetical protein